MAERKIRIREALPGETPHFIPDGIDLFRGLAIRWDEMCIAGELQPGSQIVIDDPGSFVVGVGYVFEPVEGDLPPDHVRES